jgi:hypothetical protein
MDTTVRRRKKMVKVAHLDPRTKLEHDCAMDVIVEFQSRPETTLTVTRGAARLLVDLGYAPLAEVTLPNGRRADLVALGPKGDVLIVEVKSGLEDFRVDRKWPEYAPYCDAFYFAVSPDFPEGILPDEPGLIVADGFGGAVVREAPVGPLAPARRKALTLAFARLAALRAAGVNAERLSL